MAVRGCRMPTDDRLLTPGEVAAFFHVHVKTVQRWEKEGRIKAIRTPGNHRRFRVSAVRELAQQQRGGR
jgi:excisionase family DNA binding protein